MGHVLENIVYLELLRRGYEVYVGQLDDGSEVDFVAIGADTVLYYQVAATTLEETTLKRELAPFKKISDNYPKYLLTLDEAYWSCRLRRHKKTKCSGLAAGGKLFFYTIRE